MSSVRRGRRDPFDRNKILTLKVDGEVDRSTTTDKMEEMERWVTDVGEIPLGAASLFVPPDDFDLRVKADFAPRFVFLFIPWSRDTGWNRIPLAARREPENEPAR